MHEILSKIVGAKNVLINEPMNRHTTFKIGGPAEYFVVVNSIDEFKKKMHEKLTSNYERELIIGNTLVGPYRDDFKFKLLDNDLLVYGRTNKNGCFVIKIGGNRRF